MIRTKCGIVAIAIAAACSPYPQTASAEGFTGEDFLKWSRESQDSLITYSVTMTAIIATQGHDDIASCIDEWYSDKDAIQERRQNEIIQIIRENPTYHPQGVILAVLQKECGSFGNRPG